MLSGYEYELAKEIHQERLRRVERSHLQLMAEAATKTKATNWQRKTHNATNFLHVIWGGIRNVKTYKPVK